MISPGGLEERVYLRLRQITNGLVASVFANSGIGLPSPQASGRVNVRMTSLKRVAEKSMNDGLMEVMCADTHVRETR
jgi:hypothetical protein